MSSQIVHAYYESIKGLWNLKIYREENWSYKNKTY